MNQPKQQQEAPGIEAALTPQADHGEASYKGSGKLQGKATIITGGDSGIGRAVAQAFAREGADVLIAYLNEHEDARETARLVEEAGRKAVLMPGELADLAYCRAVKHMKPGSTIINTTSINSDKPKPKLLAYATTKGAIANFTAGLAQLLPDKGIRVNSVAPGPIWTPLIPSTMPPEEVESFGQQVPMKRPGQPAEVAPVYVLLASDEASYISGARIAVTGGTPIL